VTAGRGAIEAKASVLAMAERIGAPVATTLKAKDLFRGEAFDMEIAGGLSGPVTREIFESVDLLISIGASLNGFTTRNGTPAPDRRRGAGGRGPAAHPAGHDGAVCALDRGRGQVKMVGLWRKISGRSRIHGRAARRSDSG
jgi:hypothetical protein